MNKETLKEKWNHFRDDFDRLMANDTGAMGRHTHYEDDYGPRGRYARPAHKTDSVAGSE